MCVCVCLFLTCFRLDVLSGLPVLAVFAKIILEVKRFFSLISRLKKEVAATSHGAESKRCVKGIKSLVGLKHPHAEGAGYQEYVFVPA